MNAEIELGVEWRYRRLLIITGVGRSGTTALADLFREQPHTYVLYEPVIAKYLLSGWDELFRALLMEDYFIPLIRKVSRGTLDRRKEIVEYIERANPLFVLKTLESQFLIPKMREVFPGCLIIHAVRSGYDVIGSAVKRGWYTDQWLESGLIDYIIRHRNCKIPWYLPDSLHDLFVESDQINRIALVWALLVKAGINEVTWRYGPIGSHEMTKHPKPVLAEQVFEMFADTMIESGYEL